MIEPVQAFRTSDGRVFATKVEAAKHEVLTRLPTAFERPAPSAVVFIANNWRRLLVILKEVEHAVDAGTDTNGQQSGQERDGPASV